VDYDRLRELQQKFEENPRRYFAPLANEYRKGGQHKRAIEICRTHLAQMPGHMSGQIVFGQALFEAGEWDEARTVFGRALALDPENLIALRSLGDMSLQAGDTAEARKWYTRLLDADPKDTAVIALISEIDSSPAAAVSPTAADIPQAELQAIESRAPESAPQESSMTPETSTAESLATESSASDSPQAESQEAGADTPLTFIENAPAEVDEPIGLERHYPVESAEPAAPSFEDLGGTGEAIEGIRSAREDVGNALTAKQRDEADALDSWAPPPGATVDEQASSSAETEPESEPEQEPEVPAEQEAPPAVAPAPGGDERSFSGASAAPFVNETMAQLYLQQGYRQLALKVYRQLSASRPHDQSLRDRIADIEAADAAEHPEEVRTMRKEEPSIERPTEPASPRSPSIESPTPWNQPGSEESPGVDRSPIDSPPSAPPSRDRESIEAPAPEEPRAEPEGIAARQPSIREFFATLGRRRPPRPAGAPGARTGRSMPPDTDAAVTAPVPGASLDAVFAGASVSPSDARAASRLAGAFSGATGASRTPPTPPMPTPRVNPRIPQAQESEEDVAKFRAWLDGLTRE
jgi:tetratricopeptide (TPR) repeat protein